MRMETRTKKQKNYFFFLSIVDRIKNPAFEKIAIPIKSKIIASRIILALPNISKINALIKQNIPKTSRFSFFLTILISSLLFLILTIFGLLQSRRSNLFIYWFHI